MTQPTQPSMKFDVVVGNPPYNEASQSDKHATKQKGARNLWIYFFEVFSKSITSDGLISFVTPNHWLRDTNKIKQHMMKGEIIWAEIGNIKRYFPNTGSTFTAWLWSPRPGRRHAVFCNGTFIDISQDLIPLNAQASEDDWQFLTQDFARVPIAWTRANKTLEMRTPCIVIERASPMKKIYMWDGETRPKGDWYYHNFENVNDCNDVLNFLQSTVGQRILGLVRSGMAMTHVINKVPVLSNPEIQ
jgi:hypothetical protein